MNPINRRTFIRNTALAMTPLILSPRLFGKASPSNTLNVGIVGCGTRFWAHFGELAKIPGVRITAVCDVWDARAEGSKNAVNKRYKDTNCKAYHDYRELCADPELDIVTVACPDNWHALVAVEAANRGKHIYLDKPFAYTVSEGRAVIDAVKLNGVILQYGTQQRSMQSFQHMTYLSHHGYLGEVNTAYAISPPGAAGGDATKATIPDGFDYDFFTGPAAKTPFYEDLIMRKGTPAWYFNTAFCAGWLTAWGSHHVDSAQFALGKDHEAPIKVEARGTYPQHGIYDTLQSWYAEFTYADGKKLIYCTSDQAECPKTSANVLMIGDEAWAGAHRGKAFGNPASLVAKQLPKDDPALQNVVRGSTALHFSNFIDAIRDGARQVGAMEPGHLSTSLCYLAGAAVDAQRPLTWDGSNERFVNDPVADQLLSRPMRAPWSLA